MALQTQAFTGVKLEPFARPNDAVTESVPFAASLTVAKGTVVGIITATGKYSAYATANVDGTGDAKGIAMYDFTTDASGNAIIGNDTGVVYNTAPIYRAGEFRTTELVGLDAAALVDMQGWLVSGTVADGVCRIG